MQKVALVIGHSTIKQGAMNKSRGISEFNFNNRLARAIKDKVTGAKVELVYREGSYSALPGQINKLKPDFIISLHCNAFNEKIRGAETLYFKGSKKGSKLASLLQKKVFEALGIKNRGTKPKVGTHEGRAGDRGGHLLQNTNAPCIIAEPFFIDNNLDLSNAERKFSLLVDAYVNAIETIEF